MSYIKADNAKEQKRFDFLEDLRQSGETNMYGAAPYLQAAFGMEKNESRECLIKWMKLHSEPTRRLEGPSTKEKKTVRMVTTAEIETEPRVAK